METTYMSMGEGMKKESVVYAFNGTLFRLGKERNSIMCDNLDEPGGHYVK